MPLSGPQKAVANSKNDSEQQSLEGVAEKRPWP